MARTNSVINFHKNLLNYTEDKINSLDLMSTRRSPIVVPSTHEPAHDAFLFKKGSVK